MMRRITGTSRSPAVATLLLIGALALLCAPVVATSSIRDWRTLVVRPVSLEESEKLLVLSRDTVKTGSGSLSEAIVTFEVSRHALTEAGAPGPPEAVIWRDSTSYLAGAHPSPAWYGDLAPTARSGRAWLILATDGSVKVRVRLYELDLEAESRTPAGRFDEQGRLVLPAEESRPRPLAEHELALEPLGCRIQGVDSLVVGRRLVVAFASPRQCRLPMLAYDPVRGRWAEVDLTDLEADEEGD